MSGELEKLIWLSRELGREDRKLAILGEGNTSCRVSEETFLVKASGSSLSTLSGGEVTECRFGPLLELLEKKNPTDEEIDGTLLASRVSGEARKPSTEAVFHAYLLSLEGVSWVGHTHPVEVNGILCSPRAGDFARRRIFPDEIVCCGRESALVPYVDPGLPLARGIREEVEGFVKRKGELPRIILLGNHGLIAISGSADGVMTATRMAVKAAEIFNRAALHGGPVFLPESEVARIEGRGDEHFRRKRLGL
jgi:rhamnose utilization protein RhaD (predicted bifunctional aldolase and dehydrogenase)